MAYRKKLIEVALPLDAINEASAREKSIRHGHPSTLHLWWARRPLAACRAVLFAQLVDDPSSWPDLFPDEGTQGRERERLFQVIRDMVPWEASTDEAIMGRARREIARSLARGRQADGLGTADDAGVLADSAADYAIRAYLAEVAPPVHDPFAGGGSIPLEAQRLGLRAIATDLNPVAVLINKALIEIPPRFAGRVPVGPAIKSESKKQKTTQKVWPGAAGLAEDLRRYGAWMREEAWKRIGHLYPTVRLPKEHGGGNATVIAWLWARTVGSPDPAFNGVHVPLVSSFFLSTKPEKTTWVQPVVKGKGYHFEICTGTPKDPDEIARGTKLGRGANFRCLLSGSPLDPDYIRSEAKAGRMSARLMAVVAEGKRTRAYLAPSRGVEVQECPEPSWQPTQAIPEDPRALTTPNYGLSQWAHLFTKRQLVALSTLANLVVEARQRVVADLEAAGLESNGRGLAEGGTGGAAYADAIATYLAFVVDKCAEASSTICTWSSSPKNELVVSTFRRQALPMTWDFAEANPFGSSSGNLTGVLTAVGRVIESIPALPTCCGLAELADATEPRLDHAVASLDPPYFDNIGYADLADFFYVWLRPMLQAIHPSLFRTVVTPKGPELIANPYRKGSREAAEAFFVEGMTRALGAVRQAANPDYPVSVYYAFKQSETDEGDDTASTGWETFLEALTRAGLGVTGTWPVRTERGGRSRSIDSNALASSVVLACRPRGADAPVISRRDFRRVLTRELPEAVRALQHGNIAPVDMAQAAIGPGMAVFARYSQVLEADGSAMTTRSLLGLLNEILDEHLSESEGELDADSRFAITWFETHQFKPGPYGDAENLARAKNISVQGIKEAGLVESAASKVRLFRRDELPADWDPAADARLTVWESTQHLIKRLEEQGEEAAAQLLSALGERAEDAKELAYRLYVSCERSKWAEEARAYNGLVQAWPELERLARTLGSGDRDWTTVEQAWRIAKAGAPKGRKRKQGEQPKQKRGKRKPEPDPMICVRCGAALRHLIESNGQWFCEPCSPKK